MRIGVLGSGTVGRAIAGRAEETGHDVAVGTRSEGTFATAAAHGELIVLAVPGQHAEATLTGLPRDAVAGKPVLDVTNALDTSRGMPPRIAVGPNDSVAERLQAAVPEARIVKALNTMNAGVMVRPDSVPGDHVVFLSGDDAGAKDVVRALLGGFGWRDAQMLDLGGIATARGPEMLMPLWLAIAGALGRYDFNLSVATPEH